MGLTLRRKLSKRANMNEREPILDFINKILQPEVKPRIQEYIEQEKTSGPLIVEFDPTTACNFECPECISLDLLNKGQIEPKRAMEMIEEFHRAGVKGIIFIGGGEPLAHKGMPAPIVHAHELGMSVGLTTNGSLIDRYIDEIAKHAAWTRVSVDAASQETFSIFRPSHIPMSFEKVTENIKALSLKKQGILGYSFLLMERQLYNGQTVTNCHEVYAAASLARNLGCDYFEYKPMVDKYHNLIPFSDKVRESLSEQLPALPELNTEEFRVIAPESIDHLLNAITSDQPKKYTTCPTLELRTVVTPKGIYPCPYKRGHENEKIGEPNVRFDEYWQLEERAKHTRAINPSTDCLFYCIRHNLNVFLNVLTEGHEEGIELLPYMIETNMDDVFI